MLKMIDLLDVNVEDIIIVVHKKCMDGAGAALAFYLWFDIYKDGEQPEYIYVTHGEDVPFSTENKYVIMADFSYDRDVIIDMEYRSIEMIILDHHATAEKELAGLDYAIFDMGKSGARLAWEFAFGKDAKVPDIILDIEDRDLWKWSRKNSRAVSMGLKLLKDMTDLKELQKYFDPDWYNSLIATGSGIVKYDEATIEHIIKHSKPIVSIGGLKMPCINNTHLLSEVGNKLALESETSAAAQYFIIEDKIVFSLRSIGDVDIGIIAKSFGGGGHPNAAGFSIKFEDFNFNDLLVKKKI